jgi:hypothetical protein
MGWYRLPRCGRAIWLRGSARGLEPLEEPGAAACEDVGSDEDNVSAEALESNDE